MICKGFTPKTCPHHPARDYWMNLINTDHKGEDRMFSMNDRE